MKHRPAGSVGMPQVGDRGSLALCEPGENCGEQLEAAVASTGRRTVTLSIYSDARPLSHNRRAATLTIPKGDGLRVFSGTLSRWRGGQAVLAVRAEPLRLQRRRDFRLPLAGTVRIQQTGAAGQSIIRAQLVDLSGGGAQIESASSLKAGQRIAVGVPMGDEGVEEMVDAIVLACVDTPRSTAITARFLARVSFDDDEGRVTLSEERRDEIVRFLFAQQRAALKLRRLLAPREESAPRPIGALALLRRLRGSD